MGNSKQGILFAGGMGGLGQERNQLAGNDIDAGAGRVVRYHAAGRCGAVCFLVRCIAAGVLSAPLCGQLHYAGADCAVGGGVYPLPVLARDRNAERHDLVKRDFQYRLVPL